MYRIIMMIAVAGAAMPVYAMDCKKEWVQACVGSDQDKYRDWKPPPMYTMEQQIEIMKRSKHICDYSNEGNCKDWPKEIRAGELYDLQVHELSDGTLNADNVRKGRNGG